MVFILTAHLSDKIRAFFCVSHAPSDIYTIYSLFDHIPVSKIRAIVDTLTVKFLWQIFIFLGFIYCFFRLRSELSIVFSLTNHSFSSGEYRNGTRE
jgi:hypothetical protein